MATRILKWGNSLGLRIPKPLAEQVGIEAGVRVEIVVRGGRLILKPLRPASYRLDDLLRRVTRANLHREVDTGAATGREAW